MGAPRAAFALAIREQGEDGVLSGLATIEAILRSDWRLSLVPL
jgi:hypothetical protein